MITFTDDHEAELWRATYTAWVASGSVAIGPSGTQQPVGVAAAHEADYAVLEYRKRCGPGAIPEAVDSFIRQAVNFADKVGSHTQNVATRQSATSIIQNGERLLAEGDDR